jgi:molybdate transport system substrate-binding protein
LGRQDGQGFRRARRSGLAALAGSLLALAPVARAGDLVIAAAASLREPVEQLSLDFEAARPEVDTRLSFGASSALGAQVRLGAPVDVFLSADAAIVDDLERRGLVVAGDRFALTRNRIVVIVRRESGMALNRPADLLGEDVRRFAMPSKVVPIGRYASAWLALHGLSEPLAARTVVTEHARATLAAVALGHADAAIVYASDARAGRDVEIAFEIPEAEHPPIVYSAARIATSRVPEDAAAFLASLRTERASALLRAAGFRPLRAGGAAGATPELAPE